MPKGHHRTAAPRFAAEEVRNAAVDPSAAIAGPRDILQRLVDSARVAMHAGEFGKEHALEVAAIRLGELRTVLPEAIDAAPEELRAALRDFHALI